MSYQNIKIGLLNPKEIFSNHLSIFKNNRFIETENTDFSKAAGAYQNWYWVDENQLYHSSYVLAVHNYEGVVAKSYFNRGIAIRPCLIIDREDFDSFVQAHQASFPIENQIALQYGFYPQTVVSLSKSQMLEQLYQKNLLPKSGKTYTFDKTPSFNDVAYFEPIIYPEYQLDSEKFVRFIMNPFELQVTINNQNYCMGEAVWFQVEPVTWLVDMDQCRIVSFKNLLAGIPFSHKEYSGLSQSFIAFYLNSIFRHDLFDATVSSNLLENQNPHLQSICHDLEYVKERLRLLRSSDPQLSTTITSLEEKMDTVQNHLLGVKVKTR